MESERCAAAANLAANTGDLAGYLAHKAAASLIQAAQNGGWEDPTTWILATMVILQACNEIARAIWGAVPWLKAMGPYPFDRWVDVCLS
jgi:hypothetical protein